MIGKDVKRMKQEFKMVLGSLESTIKIFGIINI